MRADVFLYNRGYATSREKARALIMAGKVTINGAKLLKPGTAVEDDALIAVEEALPYVSRGGLKLKRAVDLFSLRLEGAVAADIGASTGGFTDCMLQEGAKKVYAIDVGYGQFDWRLRNDPRVKLYERKNARHMTPDWFDEPLDFSSIDVSFISIRLILAALAVCMREGATLVALIKPQFEAGRSQASKHAGVIRDSAIHEAVCMDVLAYASGIGLETKNLCFSPITGPKGNIEFLAQLTRVSGAPTPPDPQIIAAVVREAHASFK